MNSLEKISKTIGLALLATTVVVLTIAALVLAIDFVLIIFLAILFGVFLTKTSQLLGTRIPVGYGWNLAIVTSALIVILTGSLVLFGVNIESQLDKTSQQLDRSSRRVSAWLDAHPLLTSSFRRLPFAKQVFELDSQPARHDAEAGSHLEKQLTSSTDPGHENRDDPSSDAEPSQSTASAPSQSAAVQDSGEAEILTSAAGRVFGVLSQMISTSLGAAANIILVFFIGLFLAVNPTLYRDGVVYLFPPSNRGRARDVMDEMGETLFRWLNGRFLAMLITGAGTWLALWVLGVPMAFTVGAITGILTFVPNVGAIIALLLAMLMALTQGPTTVVLVVIVYGTLQLIESNIITPLVQQHQTSIPPALLISFQLIMGALTGFLGVMVSTPLLAAGMVLAKEVWIKDTLNDASFEQQNVTPVAGSNEPHETAA